MVATHFVGLDIHKKTISFCIRQADGTILQEGTLVASYQALDDWLPRVPQPWIVGMEATMFTGWVYDHLIKYSPQVKVAHPAMLKAISGKKNDRVDAQKISRSSALQLLPRVLYGFA
jgi:transposase